jgi:cytochrome c-type biogenesis protein CcmF
MPWLAATALLHSINVLAARGALKAWTMMLAVVAFSMSMIGTFLVRSGILTSVHAFAIDPERGTFLLALLAVYVGAAFALFAWRGASLKEGAPFELVSRETGLVVNNLILSVILGVVFVGTLYPLFVEAVSGEKLSVGAPYFNAVAGPLALLLAVLVGLGPLVAWRRERRPVFKQLAIPMLLGATALAITIILWGSMHILPRLGFTTAAYLAAASILPLIGRNPLRAPLATWGMVVAHFGLAIALFGMAANAAFSTEKLAIARPGQVLDVGPWQVELASVMPTAGKNWTAVEAELLASRGSGIISLEPEARYYSDPPTQTSESAIRTFWNGQLYTVLGQRDVSGAWQLRLWWKPFVTLIWAGGALIAIGGALALLGRLWRLFWRRPRVAEWRTERYA